MRPLLREHILMDNERNQRLQKLPLSLQKNCPSLYIVCTGDLPAFFQTKKRIYGLVASRLSLSYDSELDTTFFKMLLQSQILSFVYSLIFQFCLRNLGGVELSRMLYKRYKVNKIKTSRTLSLRVLVFVLYLSRFSLMYRVLYIRYSS